MSTQDENGLFGLNDAAAALVPGRRYRIEFNDCCVNGWFEGAFQRVDYVPNRADDPPNYPNELVFDTGMIDVNGNWEAREIEDPS